MNASVDLPNILPHKGLLAQWREDVACVFQRDPAARSVFEVLTTYPGVHAVIVHRLSNRLWLAGWRYAARWLSFVARLFSNVDIHPGPPLARGFLSTTAPVW